MYRMIKINNTLRLQYLNGLNDDKTVYRYIEDKIIKR
jgi:hypothetical protein